ncbi:hypothetical protein MXD62_19360 [Frankia sp. Mgl5]|uniref:hypothetical protein n=1 Tax=Frankia sp. Mgl5 TaxID=2933793 RepID=UPI00200DC745|nr:hypothetical protein [Frankia sp. Mgl5]MCK9929310.1 hypothetical protein [Frankia sp. Mgl5]
MTLNPVIRAYAKDLIERVLRTFAWAFGAQLIASGWFSVDAITDLSILARAGVAGVAAVLALLGGLVVKALKVGNPATAGIVTSPSAR